MMDGNPSALIFLFLLIGGILGLLVGANFLVKWTDRKFNPPDDGGEGLDDLRERVLELEERQEYTDRVLAQARHLIELPAPEQYDTPTPVSGA